MYSAFQAKLISFSKDAYPLKTNPRNLLSVLSSLRMQKPKELNSELNSASYQTEKSQSELPLCPELVCKLWLNEYSYCNFKKIVQFGEKDAVYYIFSAFRLKCYSYVVCVLKALT